MILKTEAICIKNTRYGESSVISKMFTMEHGLSSFIIQGINRKGSNIRPSHIAPGNILELVVYQKPNSTIQRVKELKVITPLLFIHTDMIKNSVLQFVLEIIAKTNEDDFKDTVVFDFLKESILTLEGMKENVSMAPLLFLCRYLKFSGWFPNLEMWSNGNVFNLKEGRFGDKNLLNSSDEISENLSQELYNILRSVQNNLEINKVAPFHKKDLFIALLKYYEIHILKGKKIKSPVILAEVLA